MYSLTLEFPVTVFFFHIFEIFISSWKSLQIKCWENTSNDSRFTACRLMANAAYFAIWVKVMFFTGNILGSYCWHFLHAGGDYTGFMALSYLRQTEVYRSWSFVNVYRSDLMKCNALCSLHLSVWEQRLYHKM